MSHHCHWFSTIAGALQVRLLSLQCHQSYGPSIVCSKDSMTLIAHAINDSSRHADAVAPNVVLQAFSTRLISLRLSRILWIESFIIITHTSPAPSLFSFQFLNLACGACRPHIASQNSPSQSEHNIESTRVSRAKARDNWTAAKSVAITLISSNTNYSITTIYFIRVTIT